METGSGLSTADSEYDSFTYAQTKAWSSFPRWERPLLLILALGFCSPLSWELTAQSCCVGIWCPWGERCWVPPAPQHQAHLPLAAMRLTPAAGGLEIRWITFSTRSSGRSSCQMIPRPLVTSTVSTSVTARTAQCKQPRCGTLSAWS